MTPHSFAYLGSSVWAGDVFRFLGQHFKQTCEFFRNLGISQGVALAVAYAVKYPGKVSHLVLHGGYAPETMSLN